MTERVVHFLLHVPKCAGTTVESHFSRHLGTGYMQAPRWKSPLRNLLGNRYPSTTPAAVAGVSVVSGHSLSTGFRAKFPGAQIRESVLLRDPDGYLLSFYNYRWTRYRDGWGAEPPAFETWYRAQRRNPVSRFLMNRYFEQGVPVLYRYSSAQRLRFLERRLQDFHFVGSYRNADRLIAAISRDLGLPDQVDAHNVTAARKIGADDLPDRVRRQITRDNALDQALFDRWADRMWSRTPLPPAPHLSSVDQLHYAIGDSGSGILKKIMR